MQKLLCFILSLALIASCSLHERVTKDYKPFRKHEVNINLIKSDLTKISLLTREYALENDTIYFFDLETRQKSELALDEVAYVDAEVFSLSPWFFSSIGFTLIIGYSFISSDVNLDSSD